MLIDSKEAFKQHYAEFKDKPVTQTVYTGGIIIHQNKVLALKRADNEKDSPAKWVLPGGKKEQFEDVEEAAVREVFEETGIKTKIIGLANAFSYQVVKDDSVRDTTQVNFVLTVAGKGEPKVILSEEHDGYEWMSREKAQESNLSQEVKAAVEIAFKIKI